MELEAWLKARVSAEIRPGLGATRAALELLSRRGVVPPPSIVVVGTHGKGTTCALIASLLDREGVCVGLFTSPHLVYLSERYRVGGRLVDEASLRDEAERLLGWLDEGGVALTFFEFTFVLGVLVFATCGCELVVFEAGLGGRLDCVNTLSPVACVMTPLGLDHQEYLGDTIQQVFFEKQAVRRSGVPFFISTQPFDGAEALVDAAVLGAPEVLWSWVRDESGPLVLSCNARSLVGWSSHAATALRVSRYLGCGSPLAAGEVSDAEVEALLRVSWPGRMERRRLVCSAGAVTLRFDGAHHPESMALLRELVDGLDEGARPPLVLLGTLSNRDSALMYARACELTSGPVISVVNFHELSVRPVSVSGLAWVDVSEALELACWLCGDLLAWRGGESEAEVGEGAQVVGLPLVCGSLYLIGALYRRGGVLPDDLSLW